MLIKERLSHATRYLQERVKEKRKRDGELAKLKQMCADFLLAVRTIDRMSESERNCIEMQNSLYVRNVKLLDAVVDIVAVAKAHRQFANSLLCIVRTLK